MKIHFRNRKTEKQFDDARLYRVHGPKRAERIRARLYAIYKAENLSAFWPPKTGPERCHELTKNLKGKFSMDLDHPYRLIFEPAHDPVPRLDDGGIDWQAVTEIIIIGVEDTHE